MEFIIQKESEEEFKEKYNDDFIEVERYQTKNYSPELPNGERIEFVRDNIRYKIKNKEMVLSCFVDFFSEFYELFIRKYNKEEIPMQNAFIVD